MDPLQEYLSEYNLPPQMPYEQFSKISSAIATEARERFGPYAAEVVELLQPGLTKAASVDLSAISDKFDEVERRANLDLAVMCKAAALPFNNIKDLPFVEKVALVMTRGSAKLLGTGIKFVKGTGSQAARGTTKVFNSGVRSAAKSTEAKAARGALKSRKVVSIPRVDSPRARQIRQKLVNPTKAPSRVNNAINPAPSANTQTVRPSAAPKEAPTAQTSTTAPPSTSGQTSSTAHATNVESGAKAPAAQTPTTTPPSGGGQTGPAAQVVHANPKVEAIVKENPELVKMMQPGGATSPTEILTASGGTLNAGQQHTLLSTHYGNLQRQLEAGGLNAAEITGLRNAMTETSNMLKQLGNTGAPIQQGMFGGFGGPQGAGDIIKKLRWPAAGVGAVYLGSKALGGGQQYTPQGY